jgi:hypothetical protein
MPDQYRGNLGSNTVDTGSQPSPFIWAPIIPIIEEIKRQEREGYHLWDTFDRIKLPADNTTETYWSDGWMFFGSTGVTGIATQSSSALVPAVGTAPAFGVVTLGSDGDNEGAYLRQAISPFRIVGPNSTSASRGPSVAIEARVLTSTIADTKHGIICGLVEDVAASAIVPITAAGAIADKNIVGFHRLEGDGDQFDCIYKADGITQVTVLGDASTIVASTYTKLGLVYTDSDSTLRYYANGVLCASSTAQATKTSLRRPERTSPTTSTWASSSASSMPRARLLVRARLIGSKARCGTNDDPHSQLRRRPAAKRDGDAAPGETAGVCRRNVLGIQALLRPHELRTRQTGLRPNRPRVRLWKRAFQRQQGAQPRSVVAQRRTQERHTPARELAGQEADGQPHSLQRGWDLRGDVRQRSARTNGSRGAGRHRGLNRP